MAWHVELEGGGRLEQGPPSLGMQSTKAISIEPHLPRFGYGRCSNLLECVCECFDWSGPHAHEDHRFEVVVAEEESSLSRRELFYSYNGRLFFTSECLDVSIVRKNANDLWKHATPAAAACSEGVVSGWSWLRKHVWSACTLMIFQFLKRAWGWIWNHFYIESSGKLHWYAKYQKTIFFR